MALKASVRSIEEVPEGLRDHYVKVGDEYVLDTDDGTLRSKISEFRTNNIELRQERERLEAELARFKGVDPEKFQAALQAQQKLEELQKKGVLDKIGVSDEEFQKLLDERTTQMRSDFESQVEQLKTANKDLTTRRDLLESELKRDRIKAVISEAASEFGVPRKGAMAMILDQAAKVWDLDEKGRPIAMQDGRKMFGPDGENPLTPVDWVRTMARDFGYLFEANAGGGAGGGGSPNGGAPGVISWDDSEAISQNIEAIRDGKIQVVRPGG